MHVGFVDRKHEILKTLHHKEKPANESAPILKPVGPQKFKNFRQPTEYNPGKSN